jgi:hypothetical protein
VDTGNATPTTWVISVSLVVSQKFSVTAFFNLAMTQTTAMFFYPLEGLQDRLRQIVHVARHIGQGNGANDFIELRTAQVYQRQRYSCKLMMSPYERLKSLDLAAQYLKADETFQQLDAQATTISDNDAS